MASREVLLNIDTNGRKLVSSFSSTLTGTLPALVLGDSTKISTRFLKPTNLSGNPWEEADISGLTVRVGIGIPGAAPTSGTFTITYGGDETSALDYNASATAVQTALNALASITSAGGVTVTKSTGGAFRIIFTTAGDRTAFTLNTDAISPSSDSFVSVIREGTGSLSEIVLVSLETAVAAYAELTTSLPSAAITINTAREGATGVSDIQTITLDPIPYAGTYTLTVGSDETASIPYNASAAQIETALDALTGIGAGKSTVTGDFPNYAVSFDPTLGDVAEMTTNVSALTVPVGKSGELSTNTGELKDLFAGASKLDATFEVQLYNSVDGTTDTLIQESIIIREDVIANSPSSPAGGPTYITTASLKTSIESLSAINLDTPTLTSPVQSVVVIGDSGATQTIDLTSGTVQTCTLTDNCTFTMPSVTAGKDIRIFLNTGAGSLTATFTGVKWTGGAAPTITATAARLDILKFSSDGTNWYGDYLQNYTP